MPSNIGHFSITGYCVKGTDIADSIVYRAQAESNMLNYDLTPAKWASGNSTMRFSVENCPKK